MVNNQRNSSQLQKRGELFQKYIYTSKVVSFLPQLSSEISSFHRRGQIEIEIQPSLAVGPIKIVLIHH